MRTTTSDPGRSGFALPVAVFALVVVGILVTGGFFMARQETRIGMATENTQTAFYLAERGAIETMAHWTTAYNVGPWNTTTVADTTPDGTWTVTITPMTSRLFFLDATGTASAGGALWSGATRRVGVIARINTANVMPRAGLTTQGYLKFGGSAEIHGTDEPPDGSGGSYDWGSQCDGMAAGDKPGILIDDTTHIDWNGNRTKIEGAMTGDPKFTEDPDLTPANLMDFGDLSWDDMVALADKVLSGSPNVGPAYNADGTCNPSPLGNWGMPTDTTDACFNYFPIIYSTGDLSLSSGAGQGILLVNGDLQVTGGFDFYGPVFVKGTLTTTGAGGHFWGGVVAANADISTNTVLGNAVINFSECAVQRAILNNSALTKARPLASRSWVDLSSEDAGS